MSYSNDQKPSGSNDFLLKEDTFYLLLETGDKIIIRVANAYTNDTKNSSVYTNDSK